MRIGIVNDLALAVEALKRAIALQPGHRLAWTARDGAEAVALCAKDRPDLVLMDLLMPNMDGVEATRRIMRQSPCAILVVTSCVGANAWKAFEAMGHGALDAVDTPVLGAGALRESAAPLLAKLDTIAHMIAESEAKAAPAAPFIAHAKGGQTALLAIGASAGGPAALATVLQGLPKDFPAAIAIVQHVDAQFAPSLAEWLGQQSPLPVRIAREGEELQAGTALLAGTNQHLCLKSAARVGYTAEPLDYSYRPSVDVLFQSVSRYWPGPAVGVLLTGMGRDGAVGLRGMRNKGHYTIAQDQASCVVYGMPKAAATLKAAIEILPLDRISPRLAMLCPRQGPTPGVSS